MSSGATEFRILGPIEALVDGAPVPLGAPKQRLVLAELLLHANAAVSRERLVEAVWGERPPGKAAKSLQVYVHGLRRALGADRIATTGTAYRLRVEPGELDLDRFDRHVADAQRALDEGRPAEAVTGVEAALALWRGSALADLADEEGARSAARTLEDRHLEAVELGNEALLALGRHEPVVAGLEQLIAEHPYRERLRAQQIVALYRAGRQRDALEAYRAAREAWVEELGIDPTPALQELERAVLRHDPSLAAPAVRAPGPGTLPVPPTPLVGRRLEIAAVAALLLTEARLVTLVGPGGTGKTRLAIAVAEEVAPSLGARPVFVDLSATSDPQLLVPAVLQALGLTDSGRPLEVLRDHLREETPLLVLDNLEQLVAGAPRIAELVAASPQLRVLVTSRVALRLSGEHEYAVPPLPVPQPAADDLEELAKNETVRLFVARARAVDTAFTLDDANAASVAAICRRLDGLPLGIELAAARVKLLPPAQMLSRLDRAPGLLGSGPRDAPARQRTLAATIEWSYELLDAPRREAFARLAVFAGGCTLEAAEEVGGVDLDSLATLVDHSLLQRQGAAGAPRFAMLETVRDYAFDRLDEPERDALQRRLTGWLTDLAEAGADDVAALDAIAAEHDNLRAALEWTIEAGEADLALRLASSLRTFWEVRGHMREGDRWLGRVLALPGGTSADLRARALGVAGGMAFRSGELERAQALFEEMLGLWTELGDAEGIARGLSDVGTIAAGLQDLDRASELLEQSASRFRELDNPARLAIVLSNLGHVAGLRGELDAARAITAEALELEQRLQKRPQAVISLYNLGSLAVDAGDLAEGRERLRDCLSLTLELGFKEVAAYAVASCVRISLAEGDAAEAARLAGVADALLAEAGVPLQAVEQAKFEHAKETARERLGEQAFAAAHSDGETAPTVAALEQAGLVDAA